MPAEQPKKVQFNVYLPADLAREVKHHCVDTGESLSAYLERVLRIQMKGGSDD